MAANNGMYPGVGGAMLPSAGHHMDMNHLMSVVTSLSQQLAENREAFVRMQESMARLRVSDGFDLNLPGNAGIVEEYCEEMFGDWKSRLYREGSHTSLPDIQALQNALDESNNRIQDLLAFQQSQAEQIEDHQRTLQGVTEKIRNYSFEHTNTTI
ncbi:hypothetical protein LTR28_000025, partial [Elasticomyces elasticus]